MIKRPMNPCTPECENHKLYCRRDCENYKYYEERLHQYYDEKYAAGQLIGDLAGVQLASIKRGKQGAYTNKFYKNQRNDRREKK